MLLVFTRFTKKNIPTNFNIIHHFRECMMHKLSLDFVKRSGIYILVLADKYISETRTL